MIRGSHSSGSEMLEGDAQGAPRVRVRASCCLPEEEERRGEERRGKGRGGEERREGPAHQRREPQCNETEQERAA